MNNKILLSICIPTDGSINWVLPVIDAIYKHNTVSLDSFEVVVTDNGENSRLGDALQFFKYKNLRYIKTEEIGFFNLIRALKEGKGILRKMLNHRSVLLPGIINNWIEICKIYCNTKPVLYFLDGNIKGNQIIDCENIDKFIDKMSVWCSWSAGISVWDKDIPKLNNIQINPMFPNSSLLFNLNENARYIIINEKYQNMLDETGKGGYKLFETFGTTFLDMLFDLKSSKRISDYTFTKVKKEVFYFLCHWYYTLKNNKSKYSFEDENIYESIKKYYSLYDYCKLIIIGNYKYIYSKIMRKLHHLKNVIIST